MNGKPYAIVMAPSAHKRYKKYDPKLQQKIKDKARNIASSPYSFKQLASPLNNIRSYSFHYQNTEYRIAYRINPEQYQVEIVLVKNRENFYNILNPHNS
ncbi:MAG: type II toxin-antitoxin system RelE/ParE family toxin [Thermodesulfobacteriota bacterium]